MVDPVCLLWRLEPPSFFSLLALKMGTSMKKLGLNLGDLLEKLWYQVFFMSSQLVMKLCLTGHSRVLELGLDIDAVLSTLWL